MSICTKSSMSRPWPRWSEPSPSIPTMAGGYAGLAEVLSQVGRTEEAAGGGRAGAAPASPCCGRALSCVGTAYYLAGRPEEAIAPLKQYLTHYPNILGAHLTLAAVYSELGKEAEARAEAAEVLRINPNSRLKFTRRERRSKTRRCWSGILRRCGRRGSNE